jgi:hypothetical protein
MRRGIQPENSLRNEQEQKMMTSPTSSYPNKRSAATKNSDEIALLDTLLKGFGISNDAQLAAWLGIDKSLIYFVRAGKRRLGIIPRLRILDHIGFLKARSILESILPENLAKVLVEFNNQLVAENIVKAVEQNPGNPNIALLEATKIAFGYRTDAELACFLEIEHNTIATIRSGKSALGPKPKLKILAQATHAFDTNALLTSVESSKKLVKLLQRYLKQSNQTLAAAP